MEGDGDALAGRWTLLVEEQPLEHATDFYVLAAGEVRRDDGTRIGSYTIDAPGLATLCLSEDDPAFEGRREREIKLIAVAPSPGAARLPIDGTTETLEAVVRSTGGKRRPVPFTIADDWTPSAEELAELEELAAEEEAEPAEWGDYWSFVRVQRRIDGTSDRRQDRAVCNRYRMTERQYELALRYGVKPPYEPDEVYPPGEVFPAKPAWIVRQLEGERRLNVMRWGVPTEVSGKRPGTKLKRDVTNVRNLESPFWRSTLVPPEQRCLVPVTSFSEYGQTRGADGKMPLYWFEVPSEPVFSFAGIWRPTAAGRSFAFLTCEPNALVAPIHPKAMPVILHREDEQRWLDGTPAAEMATCFPSQLMAVEQ